MEHSFIGIDVAKAQLDVHLRPSGETFRVPNDEPGLAALLTQLRVLRPALIALEATGGYEVPVAAVLAGAGLPVAVINPRQIRDFARATGRLAKTDRVDACVIALFAEAVRPTPRPVPDEQAQALGELMARRRQLVDMLTAEQNRRRQVRARHLQRQLDAHIAWLEEALRRLDHDLTTLVRSTPIWRAADDLLRSVPGIGPVTACTLIADLPELGHLDGRAGALRPGQWHLPRPPHDRRRSGARAPRAVYGDARRHQIQPCDPPVPPALGDRWTARQGRHHGSHA